ncbi:MAG: autotransporter-associated beta strand repeat-containing protein [Verrucomicrobiota bacterium]
MIKPSMLRSAASSSRRQPGILCCWSCSVAIFVFGRGVTPAADLLRWDVTGATGASGSAAASTLSAGVSGSALTGGGTTGNSGSPANTWNRTFTVTADFAEAQTVGNFFSFSTSAEPGYTVSISGMTGLNLSRTSIGPTTAGLFYSTDDGLTFTQTGSTYEATTNSLVSAAPSFDDAISTAPIVIAGGQTVHWRLVVFGGISTNRIGIGKAATDDFSLTGTSVPDVAVHNLLWTGTGGSNWNTLPGNTNWANTDLANVAAPFITNDNVAINLPGTINVDANGVTAGQLTIGNASGTVALTGGSITGLALLKSAAGTASLNGFNSFPGGVSVTGGVLKIENDSALGVNPVSINGAILRTTADVFSVSNPVSVGTAGVTLDTDGDVSFSGLFNATNPAVNTPNSLIKSGPGVLTLSTALGSQMTFDSTGGAVELDIMGGGVIFTGSGQRNFGDTSTWDGPVTLRGGILMMHGGQIDGSGSITVAANTSIRSRLNFNTATLLNAVAVEEAVVLGLDSANGNNALAISGVISGNGAVTKTGNGTVRMEGANTYTGITTIEAGTLRVGTGANGNLGTGNVVINAGTLFLNRNDATTIPNEISGAGNVTVSAGSNIAALTGTNIYSGATTVTGGTLRINGDSSAATGVITVNTGAALGGNGVSGGAVVLQAGGGIAAKINNWTGGVAGMDFDDLTVASLDAAAVPMTVVIDTATLMNFAETAKSFPILNATGGIANFSSANVTVSAPGFAGTGGWALGQSGNSLVLSYTPGSALTYQSWATGPPWNLTGSDALAGADPDKDGISNAIEFVIGGIPATFSDTGRLPVVTITGENLVFTFRRSDLSAYLNPAAQYGSDLTGWITAQHNVAGVSIMESNDIEPGIDSVVVTIPQSLAGGSKFFARLRVVVP